MENPGKHCPISQVGHVLELILGCRSDSQCTSSESKWGFDLTSLRNPPTSLPDLRGNRMPGQLGQSLAPAHLSLAPLSAPGALCCCLASPGPTLLSLEMQPLYRISILSHLPWPMPHFLFLYAATIKDPWRWGLVRVRFHLPQAAVPITLVFTSMFVSNA